MAKTEKRRNSTRCILLLCFLCGAVLLSAAAGWAAPRETADVIGRPVRSITFSADLPVNRAHLDPYIGIRPGDALTRTGVKAAIQFLYETGRFDRIAAEAFPEDDGVRLEFRLRHKYYFNRFSLEGDVNLRGRTLQEWVSLPVGQRFTGEKLEEARHAVLKFLRERGYYSARVRTRIVADDKHRQVDTVFEAQPGKLASIRAIDLAGVPPGDSKEMLDRFGFRQGNRFDRSRLSGRLDNIRKYFVESGYLGATIEVSESFDPETNTVALALGVANFGKVRVAVDGYKIDRDRLRRLLPVLAGEGIHQDILEEGLDNLRGFMEEQGYPEAEVRISEETEDSGIRVFRYEIIPNNKFTVAYVRFKGNRALTDEELLASVEIQPATFFQRSAYSVRRLDRDLESLRTLYAARGYLGARVIPLIEPLRDARKLGITYLCEEGPLSRTRSIEIRGNAAISESALREKMKLAPGSPYSPTLAERDRLTILSAYNDLGYLQAQVTVRAGPPDDAAACDVAFDIQEGPQVRVDRILILGNDRTKESVIARRIQLREGEPLSLGRVLQTQQSLYEVGVFDQVRVEPQNPESTAPYQNVVVRLQESKRLTLRYGLGYQTREKLRGTLELSQLNVFGSTRSANVHLRGSTKEQQALFSLQQPRFRALSVDSYFTCSASREEDVSFDSGRFNVGYQFSHPFGGHSWGMFRYKFEKVVLSNVQVASDVEREDSPRSLSTFSIAYVSDTRDDYLDPTKGFYTSTDFGVTTRLLGSNNYVSFFSQNSYFRRIPKSLLMAAALRIRLARPYGSDTEIPISERFFAGGASSLRGFETDYAGPLDPVSFKPMGGNALIAATLEIRVPLFRSVHVAGFYDTGNVFATVGDIRLSGFSHSLGLGLRIRTPLGPLRADYGYHMNIPPELRRSDLNNNQGLTPGHFFITVGPPF